MKFVFGPVPNGAEPRRIENPPSPSVLTDGAFSAYFVLGPIARSGLLEATNLSVGRGTDQPFEIFGAPWIEGRKLAAELNAADLPGLRFVPIDFTPASSKFAGETCQGCYITVTDRMVARPQNSDFYPGEYTQTIVYAARRTHAAVMDALLGREPACKAPRPHSDTSPKIGTSTDRWAARSRLCSSDIRAARLERLCHG